MLKEMELIETPIECSSIGAHVKKVVFEGKPVYAFSPEEVTEEECVMSCCLNGFLFTVTAFNSKNSIVYLEVAPNTIEEGEWESYGVTYFTLIPLNGSLVAFAGPENIYLGEVGKYFERSFSFNIEAFEEFLSE